jgi:hypothetical protein
MILAYRAASEIASWAFSAVALATVSLYIFALRSIPFSSAVTTAVALGSVAGVASFLVVSALVTSHSSGEGPVLGARRGAGLAVFVLFVAASVHALFTSGLAGFLYSLFGQVGYSLLLCGVPFAVAGAVLGRSVERRILSSRDA